MYDATHNALPSVAYVDPEDGDDYHASQNPGGRGYPADIRDGTNWLQQTVSAVLSGPQASSTVVIVTFDEAGGFFDHVQPPRVVASNSVDYYVDGNGKAPLGFRVPTIVISPFSVGSPSNPRVSSLLYDHTSILKFIEWRFGLPTLAARDASTDVNNLACTLNLNSGWSNNDIGQVGLSGSASQNNGVFTVEPA